MAESSVIQQISDKMYSDRIWMKGRMAVVSEPLLKIVESFSVFLFEKRTLKTCKLK